MYRTIVVTSVVNFAGVKVVRTRRPCWIRTYGGTRAISRSRLLARVDGWLHPGESESAWPRMGRRLLKAAFSDANRFCIRSSIAAIRQSISFTHPVLKG